MQINCVKTIPMKVTCTNSFLSVLAISLTWVHSAEQPEEATIPSEILDQVVVTANRSDQTLYEQILPANVLSDDRLLLRIEPTLGETLNRLPGVSSTYFAPGSSRPVLRGMGDDRVRMLQNGTSLIDVSNVSPDHAVTVDPLSVQSIEVVRGPATLIYGPNTLGGVVNVIDNRIAEERFSGTHPKGRIDFMGGTADNSLSQSAEFNWGQGPWVFHLDLFNRETENIDIPGFARSSAQRALDDPSVPQPYGTLPNSFTNSEGLGLGASHIFENGYLGFSFSGMNSDYGTVGEPDVTIDLEQRRWDMRGAVYEPLNFLREIRFNFGYSDYTHTEFEGSEVGTVFDTEGFNGRVEFMHKAVAGYEGTFGYEIQFTDFAAAGEEAFLPGVDTQRHALFFFEEKEWGRARFQFGARYDHHSNESLSSDRFGPGQDVDMGAFSASTGVIYEITEDYAASFSLAYTQRPPTYVELFANGPHKATSTVEIGDVDLDREESFSADFSIRKKNGWVTGSAGAFFYRFNDYINLSDTGDTDPDEELPIFVFDPINADFYGFELETIFHLLGPVTAAKDDEQTVAVSEREQRLDLILRADCVHAENRDSGDALPRIPPFRIGTTFEYEKGPLTASIEGQYAAEQNRTADFELPTDSYFLINAGISYRTEIAGMDSTCYVRGVNLTDEEARLSTSFLKDVAPLAGRGVIAGIRVAF